MSSIIVLGTDTDAGKTTYAVQFLAKFVEHFEYWKPLETGDSDTERVRKPVPNAVVHEPLMRFAEPVAPALAARREGRTIPTSAELLAAVPKTQRRLLIETFGSPLSPLNDSELQIEFIRKLEGECVLVASSAVGAVGRTLQALDALAGYGVVPSWVVLMGERDEYAEAEITKHRNVPVHSHSSFVLGFPSPSRTSTKPIPTDEGLLTKDQQNIWHPYTALQAPPPLPVVSAEREFLRLADGRTLIDSISSWWTILHGHCFPPLVRALKSAADRLDHVLFAGITHPDAVDFAERILRTAPWTGGRVFFSDNGSTAVEVALKMAYQFWCHRGEPQRTRFIGFENAYHGDTFGAMSVGRDRLFFGHFEPLLFAAEQLPVDPNRLDDFLTKHGKTVAGIILEPLVQGAGGMRMHTPDTLRDLFTVAKRHGIPFIADEVMTGNRTGRRWAFQHAGIAPDLICASKTLTGGMMPLAVTLAGPEIVAAFDTADRTKTFFHGHSFTANPLACAIAAVNERLLAEPEPLARTALLSRIFTEVLTPLRDHPRVADVRILGSIAAVEVRADGGYLASEAERWKAIALNHGVFLRPLGNVIYTMPPLGTSEESLRRITGAIRACLA